MDIIFALHCYDDFTKLSKDEQIEALNELTQRLLADDVIASEFPYIQSISLKVIIE